ncbi:hypothetical protein [uncultured Gimesia sp.]|uniref:hypothetical protein n=1 Tax=uncultured Gimesia sp. TaxID=1678688 RepID=UPI0026380704|nr:hypothetical protein [uncultured Gimesia sp.]
MQYFIIMITLSLFLATGCAPTNKPDPAVVKIPTGGASIKDQRPDMDALKRWVDSLTGKSTDEIKQIFSDTKPVEETWESDGEGGKLISYEFPTYDLALYCSEGEVVLVSIDMSPKLRE